MTTRQWHKFAEIILSVRKAGLDGVADSLEREVNLVFLKDQHDMAVAQARANVEAQVANSKLHSSGIYHSAGDMFNWDTPAPGDLPVFTSQQFLNHMRSIWDKLEDTIEDKDAEYGSEEDTFGTIKHIAKAWGERPRNVALKLALKHYMSLLHEGDNLDTAQVRERINDIHVYLEIADCNWEEQ